MFMYGHGSWASEVSGNGKTGKQETGKRIAPGKYQEVPLSLYLDGVLAVALGGVRGVDVLDEAPGHDALQLEHLEGEEEEEGMRSRKEEEEEEQGHEGLQVQHLVHGVGLGLPVVDAVELDQDAGLAEPVPGGKGGKGWQGS